MNYSKIYFFYECNRSKQDLQNKKIYNMYILVIDIIGVKHSHSFKTVG